MDSTPATSRNQQLPMSMAPTSNPHQRPATNIIHCNIYNSNESSSGSKECVGSLEQKPTLVIGIDDATVAPRSIYEKCNSSISTILDKRAVGFVFPFASFHVIYGKMRSKNVDTHEMTSEQSTTLYCDMAQGKRERLAQ